ncbi:MAG: UDP-N-acetylglucosamine 2-epimerase [Spirochaetia bacterium]|jgi:GDP/UDP-N,N'-diacetylbacillosamine 2-epimerase (hydrolysing)|uniref:GDP/UDP-N,N'-diacetylbacillosamine 2-epimerase (Hydrolyzing) n=1 Tax=bioreactor metagenome TaxID=1076179 RepID=A0A644TVQ8_9ZZZZ|nr:UDP-N-acetylglucosamine 2-epimerase [Spirochaetia bacterium]MCE1209334.1 UDP-N-acetylglucosamine 2-epimerase [Spirochaetia bacterium]
MAMKRIAVFTGSRAEYGLLRPVIAGLLARPDFQTFLLVTGMHLSPEFGMTVREIENDGFPIAEKIEILLSSDTSVGTGKSMGLAMISISEAFARMSPDLVVILGDRFEALCAAIAATLARVPIAHIHGGELTQGAIDDAFRHSITHMSYLHFAATERYRRRIIQMGESPERVFNVGALGVEIARKMTLRDRRSLEADLGFDLSRDFLLVTFHPATLDLEPAETQAEALLAALDRFPAYAVVFTKANADAHGRAVNACIEAYVQKNPQRSSVFTSLGQERYLSLASFCKAVVGNSSSAIIETPSLGVPTVNIGNRQNGRERMPLVFDCVATTDDIVCAIRKALACKKEPVRNPYEGGDTSGRIVAIIAETLARPILPKLFYDLESMDDRQ